ncbi:MAG TPA: hypothetical protein VKX96_03750 [Chloroflexota bacterium]|nr:hypothetical protein [Chloroflexota bacterium]
MVLHSEREKLGMLIAEARDLLQIQRRALGEADFATLLTTADRFHRFAAQLGSLSPDLLLEDTGAEVQTLQAEVAQQRQLLEMTMAITVLPTRTYSKRKTVDSASHSLLIDQYA